MIQGGQRTHPAPHRRDAIKIGCQQDWRKIDTPEQGCGVLMEKGSHCGVWLDVDGGRVLHAHRFRGIVCDAPASIFDQIEGYYIPCL
ncbi:MAG: hypothetical protein AAF418_05665 [Pseudomonadota bacterium]